MACIGSLSFRLTAWFAWTPTSETAQDWCDWAGCDPSASTGAQIYVTPEELPMMIRRRLTQLGRKALGAAAAIPEVTTARYVLSTRHGELGRTASILESILKCEPVSPADFGLSVHHGLLGLLSIAQKNHAGHTAVSAGPESFCYGLMEAAACAMEWPRAPVILLHFDERPVEPFAALFDDPDREGPTIGVFCLADAEAEGGLPMVMEVTTSAGGAPSDSHMGDFIRFILERPSNQTSQGVGLRWGWGHG